MKRINAQGETELSARTIKFGCDQPYALPNEVVRVVLKKDVCEAIVRVESLGENGRCTGEIIDYVRFPGHLRQQGFAVSQPRG